MLEPIKISKRKLTPKDREKRKNTLNGISNSGALNTVNSEGYLHFGLYGEWQTEALQRQELGPNKEIPTNEYGSVDVYNGNTTYLPIGTKWLNHSYAAAAAKKLNVQHPTAITGFDSKNTPQGGRKVPVIQGVVVLAEHYDAVLATAEQLVLQKAQSALDKKQKKLWDAWKRVLTGAIHKVELREKYGC